MRKVNWMGIFSATLLLISGPVKANSDLSSQETLMRELAQFNAAVAQSGGTVAKTLSVKFNLKPQFIQKVRNDCAGWGEVAIRFSMSRQLVKSNPKDYPTYAEALTMISKLRSQSTPYDRIADQVGIDLSVVIAEVQSIRMNLQEEKRL